MVRVIYICKSCGVTVIEYVKEGESVPDKPRNYYDPHLINKGWTVRTEKVEEE